MPDLVPFKLVPLGGRFTYPDDPDGRVWVVLSRRRDIYDIAWATIVEYNSHLLNDEKEHQFRCAHRDNWEGCTEMVNFID